MIIYANPLEETLTYKALLAPENIKPKQVTVVPFTDASIEMIKNDLGVAVFAKWSIEHYTNDPQIVFKKITKQGLIRQYYAAVLKSRSDSKLLLNFTDYLHQRARI